MICDSHVSCFVNVTWHDISERRVSCFVNDVRFVGNVYRDLYRHEICLWRLCFVLWNNVFNTLSGSWGTNDNRIREFELSECASTCFYVFYLSKWTSKFKIESWCFNSNKIVVGLRECRQLNCFDLHLKLQVNNRLVLSFRAWQNTRPDWR